MKFRLIDEEKSHHSVSRLACVLGVTVTGYNAWKKRPPSARSRIDEHLRMLIQDAHNRCHDICGAPLIRAELTLAQGKHVAKKRIARLMR